MKVQLNCRIEIIKPDGKRFSFRCLNACEAEKSIYRIGSTAKIKIPTTARLVKDGKYIASEQTAKKLERGDRIDIYLGYDEDLRLEHTGYIYRVNYTTPVEIECEGFEFLLRKDCPTKTWRSTTLLEVLQYLVKDTEIILKEQQVLEVKTAKGTVKYKNSLPDVKFTNFVIKAGQTRLQVLQKIKDDYRLSINFLGAELWAGLTYTQNLGEVKYRLGWNTIKDNELKYRNADDVQLKVKAVWVKPDNTRVEVEVGDKDGQMRTAFFYDVSSKKDLERIATEELERYKYSGYEGKITTFIQPFAMPGMVAILEDTRYNERNGNYYIIGAKSKFGTGGARRTIELGIKV